MKLQVMISLMFTVITLLDGKLYLKRISLPSTSTIVMKFRLSSYIEPTITKANKIKRKERKNKYSYQGDLAKKKKSMARTMDTQNNIISILNDKGEVSEVKGLSIAESLGTKFMFVICANLALNSCGFL